MKKTFSHIVSRSLLLVIALQIFNLSVNGIDFKPLYTSNFTEFNDINSITEYISEIVLGHFNAFPEYAKKTQKQSQLQKHISIKIINEVNCYQPTCFEQTRTQYLSPLKDSELDEYNLEINPPPPKV